MQVRLYNTMNRAVAPLEPVSPSEVKIYCCGPTVYNFAHIGNMRTYIFEDGLRRALELAGYRVRHVMNITDVGHLTSDADAGEDKMLVAMRREGRTASQIADFYTDAFWRHADLLNILRPHVACRATEHITDMIGLIQRLEARGLVYQAGGNVYFSIDAFPQYGHLAGLDLEKLRAGARIDVDTSKRNPLDFVLWFTQSKFENQEMLWDSPWGRGYPGWHIECSAMSIRYLGDQFDIHCGGIDHIPVHHTNEIAQSEGATGKSPWVRVWMHGEFLVTDTAKMSKSSGEFTTVDTLVSKGYDPLAYRYLCLTSHYRHPLGFSYEALDGAVNGLENLRKAVRALKASAEPAPVDDDHPRAREFFGHLFDDLNIPRALATLWTMLKDDIPAGEKLALIYRFDPALGLNLSALAPEEATVEEIPAEVMDLVARRAEARKIRDFALADQCRDRIQALGYTVRDTPDGAVVTAR